MAKMNLGAVTAYADAVKAGFTGTREEFAEWLANAGKNAQAVAENLEESKRVLADVNTAGATHVKAVQDEGAAQIGAVGDAAEEKKAEIAGLDAVQFDVAQNKSDAQKKQARTNIDAAAQEDVDNLSEAIGELNEGGLNLKDDVIRGQVESWLEEHPEATTTVQDKSLDVEKFTDDAKKRIVNDYVTPEMYGAVCDGTTDDSTALQNAINSGMPVLVDKTLAIAKTVNIPDNGKLTIQAGVNINITADIDGFVIGSYVLIDGFGTINVTVSDYTHTCITLNGARYSMVESVSVRGYDYKQQDGIGIAILSTQSQNSAYNRLKNVNVCYLELGVLIRGNTTENGVTYKWNNNHDIDIHSSFCANAIHVISSNHHRIKLFGESGRQKSSDRTVYPCAYDTEIYLTNASYNDIYFALVDTGLDGQNQYAIWFDNMSHFNAFKGIAEENGVFDNSGRNYVALVNTVKNIPVAGVNSILDEPTVTKSYKPIGSTAINYANLFRYPFKSTNILRYTTGFEVNKNNWNDEGVSIEFDFQNNGSTSVRFMSMSVSVTGQPYRVGIMISTDGTNYIDEVILPFGLFDGKLVDLSKYINYKSLQTTKKLKLNFYGAYNRNTGTFVNTATIIEIAMSGHDAYNVARVDPFAGIRKTGGKMYGDVSFDDNTHGIVLISPNGTQYKIAVDDDGTIIANRQ